MLRIRGDHWKAKAGRWFVILTGVWLAAAALLLGLRLAWGLFPLPWHVTSYLAATVTASAICFVAYGWDKRRAVRDGRRISERTLHLLALAGGWPGAVFAQRTFRHKTQKRSFQVTFALIVAAHFLLATGGLYLWWR